MRQSRSRRLTLFAVTMCAAMVVMSSGTSDGYDEFDDEFADVEVRRERVRGGDDDADPMPEMISGRVGDVLVRFCTS